MQQNYVWPCNINDVGKQVVHFLVACHHPLLALDKKWLRTASNTLSLRTFGHSIPTLFNENTFTLFAAFTPIISVHVCTPTACVNIPYDHS